MIYISNLSNVVSFPKISNETASKIIFENQVTTKKFSIDLTDVGSNQSLYLVDLSSIISLFEVGQYNYTFYNINNGVIASGILQFDDYSDDFIKSYQYESEIIQYELE